MNETSTAATGTPASSSAFDYDVVVVGGAAAGLSAALVLTRARRHVVVVDAGHPRNAPAVHMQGFLGSDGMPPAELLAAGRAEVQGYGGELLDGTVTSVVADACTPALSRRGFDVTLDDGRVLRTRRVLITTGLTDQVPEILGVRERWGRDLLHCPYCHGHEVRDAPLGVLGGTPEALVHAHIVRQWSHDVVYFTNGQTLKASDREALLARAVGIVDGDVARIVVEDDELTGVELATGQVIPRAAVFVRPTFAPNDSLLTDLGCAQDANGWTQVDATGATSVQGVWAAGNATNPRAQVITAAGEGSAAAIAINNDLVAEDIPIAVANYRLGFPA
jgi:thioredoxin reductase